jgi:hypothetical protein
VSDWDDLYRRYGPQRPYAHRPGLTAPVPTGEIEYSDGTVVCLADLFPRRKNWRESTDGTLRELVTPAEVGAGR